MASHTQNLEDSRAISFAPATYGTLMAQVRLELDQALTISDQRPIDVHRAHAEILGYERFLRISGHHLSLLAFLAQTDSRAWRTLSERLAHLPTWESSEGRWSRAASLLGTAHDLVSTHVGPDRGLRTPEIEDLAGGPEVISTAREMLDRLEAAAQAGEHMLDRAARRQRQTEAHPTTTRHYSVLRSASRAIAVYGRAAHWDLREAKPPSPVDGFQSLAAAPLSRISRAPRFEDCLQALRLLRHFVRRQGHGEVPASAISLRDLALLGALVTDPSQLGDLEESANPVLRLEHAHFRDQLDFAHQSWQQLADHLLTQTQGLSKAPREYALAIEQLQGPLDPALRGAIARALPELGRRAGDTVRQLALHNALVSRQREPGALQAHWRPLNLEHREALADLFAEAGAASAAMAALGRPSVTSHEPVETFPAAARGLHRSHAHPHSVQR
ncbi:hypothetical protein [Marmoricola sp. URHB0036]|uniref:hypothetical protein n=1 Tax=Marmoricola sp. URHB0036 TaxID=1298863 RepID=UPI000424B54E|nr:hypothetical protein [Marmoricola sp. URHB0036]